MSHGRSCGAGLERWPTFRWGLVCILAASAGSRSSLLPVRAFEPHSSSEERDVPKLDSDRWREDALARAKVWQAPERTGAQADLRSNPRGPGSFSLANAGTCRFQLRKSSGRTPKFECLFGNGEVLKVKYGNSEVHTEAAATRLLSALGFGADRIYLLPALRCFGCPDDPHALLSCISSPLPEIRRACEPLYGQTSTDGSFKVKVDYGRHVDFGPVAVERRKPGEEIRGGEREGWGFDELDAAQSAGHGETRARRDALRLLAVFLNNWDTRADNQRLTCLRADPSAGSEGRCAEPFAYMNDVGATFGRVGGDSKAERKLDVEGWSGVPIWKDPELCTVGIKSPRLHGATFGEAVISEAGRRFLAQRLAQLSPRQIRDLFEGALFTSYEEASPASKEVGNWVRAFQGKVRQIVQRPPCPTP